MQAWLDTGFRRVFYVVYVVPQFEKNTNVKNRYKVLYLIKNYYNFK